GAELFTGNNALLMPPLISRRLTFLSVARNWTLVWIGNFIGAFAVAWFMVYLCGLTTPEPYHGAICRIAEAKVSASPAVIFLKGIGANWCVCLAVWLALSGRRLSEKLIACQIPVMAFVILGYEHCVANMFFIPLGMMEGADVSIYDLFAANLLPATVGNIVGGAVFVGCAHYYLYHKNIEK
ncbi:MAG: formate/nitrite transporter family protein, partial [Muribaculaceae bacterium]|nr:formate/nitrite transporter family protein [Muribaculaceae bacterium]